MCSAGLYCLSYQFTNGALKYLSCSTKLPNFQRAVESLFNKFPVHEKDSNQLHSLPNALSLHG